ncbi:MAG: 50S ribosomal protein L22 [Candidatus Campbellbacteria bacterium]|nr:50S ribosomal protein L22 [Candidatus Campbellbacteria bacterium]
MNMKANLKNYRQSPRKVRLLADLIRGKRADEAQRTLEFTPKRASQTLNKLIDSAVANARHNDNKKPEDLYVSEVRVDEGFTLKRFRPRARGRATRLRKRTSHIYLTLDEKK